MNDHAEHHDPQTEGFSTEQGGSDIHRLWCVAPAARDSESGSSNLMDTRTGSAKIVTGFDNKIRRPYWGGEFEIEGDPHEFIVAILPRVGRDRGVVVSFCGWAGCTGRRP